MRLRGSLFFQRHHDNPIPNRLSLPSRLAPGSGMAAWLALGLVALLFALQCPGLTGLVVLLVAVASRFSTSLMRLTQSPLFLAMGGWKTIGILAGVLLFAGITVGADPAFAIFDKAEQQASSIFGQYVDSKIITFLFGLLRIVVWITSVGFILFAVYQAQRGEQWQPLMQNAFIVIAAIVVVEGLSAMFFK